MLAGPSSVTPWVEETLWASSPWHFLLTACRKSPWEAKATWEAAWALHALLTKPTALPSLGCCVHTAGMDGEVAVSGWFLLPFFFLHKALEWIFLSWPDEAYICLFWRWQVFYVNSSCSQMQNPSWALSFTEQLLTPNEHLISASLSCPVI